MTTVERPIPNEEIPVPPRPGYNGGGTNGGRPPRVPPHDLAAEASLLGACLLSPTAIEAAAHLRATDFYKPAHGHVHAACQALAAKGEPADPVTVADELHRDGLLDTIGGPAFLVDLQAGTPAVSNAARYAAIVGDHARLRRLIAAAAEIADLAYSLPDDVAVVEERAAALVEADGWNATTETVQRWHELDAFLDIDEPDHDWVIPGLLETADRCIITATPGTGKSTLLRQIGVMGASGLHPFTAEPIDPVRVLMLDVENSERQIRREIRPLRHAAGERYDPGMLELRVYGEAINLADPATLSDIQRHVDTFQPGIICTGPLYKLIGGDPVTEKDARPVADAFDRIRHVCGSAVIIEAHSPYPVGKTRVIRPYGASLWERWPEFGWYFSKAGDIEHWRGQREEREWPAAIERSKPWPWVARAPVVTRAEAEEWHGPTKCIEAVLDFLERHPDEELSGNQLYLRLRAENPGKGGFRDETVRDAAEIAAADGRLMVRNGPRRSRLYSAIGAGVRPEDELF